MSTISKAWTAVPCAAEPEAVGAPPLTSSVWSPSSAAAGVALVLPRRTGVTDTRESVVAPDSDGLERLEELTAQVPCPPSPDPVPGSAPSQAAGVAPSLAQVAAFRPVAALTYVEESRDYPGEGRWNVPVRKGGHCWCAGSARRLPAAERGPSSEQLRATARRSCCATGSELAGRAG